MKSAIIALMLSVSLIACAQVPFDTQPDVVQYSEDVQKKAALEIESGHCPVLSNVFMPDYQVMRDQARVH